MQRRQTLKGVGAFAMAAALGTLKMAQARTQIDGQLRMVESYLASWQKKDLKGIGAYLHPQIHFKSPTSETTGKEIFLAAAQRIFPLLQNLAIRFTFEASDQVVAIYDFKCSEPVGLSRTAELITFQDGLIAVSNYSSMRARLKN